MKNQKIKTFTLILLTLLSTSVYSQAFRNSKGIHFNYIRNKNDIYYFSGDSLIKARANFQTVKVLKTGLAKADQLTFVNNRLYFVNNKIKVGKDSVWTELWSYDGVSSTRKIKAFKGVSILTPYNNSLLLAANDLIHGTEPWITNGTETGTVILKDINEGKLSSITNANQSAVVYKGNIYFSAEDVQHGIELWKSNGTPDSTILMKDIHKGKTSSNPSMLTVSGDYLYFAITNDTINNKQLYSALYKSTGNNSGTELVKNFTGDKYSKLSKLVDINGTLFFTLSTNTQTTQHNELWRTSGTAWNTEMVIEIEE